VSIRVTYNYTYLLVSTAVMQHLKQQSNSREFTFFHSNVYLQMNVSQWRWYTRACHIKLSCWKPYTQLSPWLSQWAGSG